ncbi:MAG: hypothetical protein JXA66_05245 [Oligoflexia bacterium]|nr:hypothetical protein [Oligoflexia bacterium]
MIIRKSFKDIFRHKLSSLLVVKVTALFVFLSLVFLAAAYNLEIVRKKLASEVRVTVFPAEGYDVKDLAEKIRKLEGVTGITHMDGSAALDLLKKRFPDNEIIFTTAVMPDLVEVRTDIGSVDLLRKMLNKLEGISDIVVNTSWLGSAINMLDIFRYGLVVLIVIMFVISVALIYYATRLGALQRKWEITIFRLCGATEWYIRLPYLLSSVVLGVAGAVTGVLLYYFTGVLLGTAVLRFSGQWLSSFDLSALPVYVILIVLFVSVMIGMIGNYTAFLKTDNTE